MEPEELGEMKQMVKELHAAVVGNGKPGLIAEWGDHKIEHAKIEGGVTLIKWIVGIVGLPTLASAVWMAIRMMGGH
jgi:hypothetical protein